MLSTPRANRCERHRFLQQPRARSGARWKANRAATRSYPYGYQQVWTGHPVSLLAWLKANETASFGKIRYILMAHDWVRYKLTGKFGAEITNISGSNSININTGSYDPALFDLFGIAELTDRIAPVIGSEESLGRAYRSPLI